MINAEDDVLYDLSPSCTVEVAVAKMLGWMQGHIRQRVIKVTEHGVSADQLPHIPSLEGSLQERLMEMRGAARQAFIEAAEKYASDDTSYNDLRDKEEAVIECDNLLNKAATYLRDIEDEVSKGESSEVKIDQRATDKTGETHLTLNSVDRWTKAKYGISIIDDSISNSLAEVDKSANSDYSTSDVDNDTKGVESIFITLAFLVDAFCAKTGPKFVKGSNEPNISSIADHLAELVIKSSEYKSLNGQGVESIKKRITKAMATRRAHSVVIIHKA